ncbi:putative porin [Variovorax boronicumulans]|uniref:porin n=1 Tax=Variovorax boronicumulans TaxID=436515 RepID=UPI0027843E23|nr:porin [Variovorax boronicumulans]MDP9912276.1 putative porin [Variovorax boronicumulans]
MKYLGALFVVFAPSLAWAQSSVTLFGTVDTAVSQQSITWRDAVTGQRVKQSKTSLNTMANRPSHLGFRGTEDLGGGLAASFWLEAPVATDDGSTGIATFSRRSTLSLSGGFGELRVGRDYTPTSWNDLVFDPFQTLGAGASAIASVSIGAAVNNNNYVRASNTIGYFLPPNLGGFYGHLQYGFSETARLSGVEPSTGSPSHKGRYAGARFGYANGPLNMAVSYGSTVPVEAAAQDRKVVTSNLGASYDFGAVALMMELSRVRNHTATAGFPRYENFDGALLGVTAPVGAGLLRASLSTVRYDEGGVFAQGPRPRTTKLALGYVHNLSKRTALYATVARVANRNDSRYSGALKSAVSAGYAPRDPYFGPGQVPRGATGYDFGISHSF